MDIDLNIIKPTEQYRLLIGSVQPRPVAWVSTMSKMGETNIAPFSFFNIASRTPPMMCISIGAPEPEQARERKDTLANILETDEFVINVASEDILHKLVRTAALLPPSASEYDFARLTPEKSVRISAPRIAEAPISIECRLHQALPLGSDTLIIGKALWARVADDLIDPTFHVNTSRLRPIGRMAGPNFCTGLTPFQMTAPKVGGDLSDDPCLQNSPIPDD